MKRKKDWRKHLKDEEQAKLEKLEAHRDACENDIKELRKDIRTIMTRCWSRMAYAKAKV